MEDKNRVVKMMRHDAGGEGSRGGIIIGRTSGGKPIYKDHHPSHNSFTAKEHHEAALVHNKAVGKAMDKATKAKTTSDSRAALEEVKGHSNRAAKHMEQNHNKRADSGKIKATGM